MSELNSIVESGLKKHLKVIDNNLKDSIVSGIENRLTSNISLFLKYKDAKKMFQRIYFIDLLTLNHGNIKRASSIAKMDRRQIHRICTELNIDTKNIRQTLIKPYNYMKQNVQDIIEQKLELYSQGNNINTYYKNIPKLTDAITLEIDKTPKSYDESFSDFENDYFKELMDRSNKNLVLAEELSGLSQKSISRKIKLIN